MFKGSQKPVCDVQLGYKKETGHKTNGKQEQCVQRPNHNHMPQQADQPTSNAHTKGSNKENEQEMGKSKTAKYVNY